MFWNYVERLYLGVFSYPVVMIVGAVVLLYFGWMPENDDTNQQTNLAFGGLPVWLALVLIFGGPALKFGISLAPISLGVWAVVTTWQEFLAIKLSPDLNSDGRFSISDIPSALGDIFLAPGRRAAEQFLNTPAGQFLEISGNSSAFLWPFVFTFFAYVMAIFGTFAVLTFTPVDEDD